jgi:hypothetical protein
METKLNVKKAETVLKKYRMKVRHRNEMDALYLGMACECLKIECKYWIFVMIWMYSVEVGSVASQRKI